MKRPIQALAAVFLVGGGLAIGAAAPAHAATSTFYATATGGTTGSSAACSYDVPCTLQAALDNAAPGTTIELLTSGGSSLATHYVGDLTIGTAGSVSTPVAIQPTPGVVNPILDGDQKSGPVLTINGNTSVHLTGVTIEGGNDPLQTLVGTQIVGTPGGGIANEGSGTVTLLDSTVTSNTSQGAGRGVFNDVDATLKVVDSALLANNALEGGGGAVYNDGMLIVTGSTLADNSSGEGGAIYNNSGTVTVTSTTITGNSTVNHGEAIASNGGRVILGADLLATPKGLVTQ